jgi:hypothetical protein
MTEKLLHDLFHALLPTLASHLDILLTGAVAAVLLWLRAKLQVKHTEAAVAAVEVDAEREIATGQGRPAGALKKWRAMRRASEHMNILVRPREKKLDKLVERAVKKQKAARQVGS